MPGETIAGGTVALGAPACSPLRPLTTSPHSIRIPIGGGTLTPTRLSPTAFYPSCDLSREAGQMCRSYRTMDKTLFDRRSFVS
jgi:hypothetical protein